MTISSPTNDPILLFAYGLLQTGLIGYNSLKLDQKTRALGKARIRGRLYHLGDYPGAIVGGNGIVHGEVFAFDDPTLWAEIDAYELYDPDRLRASEYRRIEVELLDSGRRAWTYEYNRPIKGQPVIASGLWTAT